MVVITILVLALLSSSATWYFYSHRNKDGFYFYRTRKVKLLYRNPIDDNPMDSIRPSARIIKSDRKVGYKLRQKFKYSLGRRLESFVKVISRAYGIKISINRDAVSLCPKYRLWKDKDQYVIDVSATPRNHNDFLTCCIFLIVHHILFNEEDVNITLNNIENYDSFKVDRIASFLQGLVDSPAKLDINGFLYKRVRDIDC